MDHAWSERVLQLCLDLGWMDGRIVGVLRERVQVLFVFEVVKAMWVEIVSGLGVLQRV